VGDLTTTARSKYLPTSSTSATGRNGVFGRDAEDVGVVAGGEVLRPGVVGALVGGALVGGMVAYQTLKNSTSDVS